MSQGHMELAGAPLGEDLLGGSGEHLRKAREHPWASTCSVAWASAPQTWRGTEAPWGMATMTRRSGMAGSAA